MDEKKLDYETAYRAVHGDHDAQMKVLAYYVRLIWLIRGWFPERPKVARAVK